MAQPAAKSNAMQVVISLREAGYQALFAGGCVRDMLLHQRCTDYDIATDATPRQVKDIFRRVLLIGEKFGVAMVLLHGRKIEVATFRNDLSYSDGRRPDGVTFSTPREDAERRDFTINGMFYDPIACKLIDYVGGQEDLRRGVIRTIGDPNDRFDEDYLRMLRAVRFSVRLGFPIDPATAKAVRKHAQRITAISGERIFDELTKMLSISSASEALRQLEELGLAMFILPDLFSDESLWQAGRRRVKSLATRKDFALTLGALLAELTVNKIHKIVRNWGAPNELRRELSFLAKHRDTWRRAWEMPLCDFKRLLAEGSLTRIASLWRIQEQLISDKTTLTHRARRRAASIPPAMIAPKPFVGGSDLMRLGLEEGPQLGRIYREMYDMQLNEEVTGKAEAMRKADELVKNASDRD